MLLTAATLAALVAPTAAGAATPGLSRTAGTRLVRLNPGDQVAVSGTNLHCSSSRQTPITLACGKGTARGPSAGTYGFALADAAALVLRVGASGQSSVVLRRRQPASAGQAAPAHAASARSIVAGTDTVILVSGTHLVCAVSAQSGGNAITCGLSGPAAGTFQTGTFFTILTDTTVLLGRKAAAGAQSVFRHAQPR